MKNRLLQFMDRLGERPLLVLWLILLATSWLVAWLLKLVLQSDGTMVPSLGPVGAARMMGGLIGVVVAVLAWRTVTVNTVMRRHIKRLFRGAVERDDPDFQKKMHQLVHDLGLRGGMFDKLRRTIRLAPRPFCTLVLVLLSARVVCWAVWQLFKHAPAESWQEFALDNTPWAVVAAVICFLIYHDVWVIDALEGQIASLQSVSQGDGARLVEEFRATLSGPEALAFQKRFSEGKLIKEVAAELLVSDRTVKTHLRNIREKWGAFAPKKGILQSLEDIVLRAKKP